MLNVVSLLCTLELKEAHTKCVRESKSFYITESGGALLQLIIYYIYRLYDNLPVIYRMKNVTK